MHRRPTRSARGSDVRYRWGSISRPRDSDTQFVFVTPSVRDDLACKAVQETGRVGCALLLSRVTKVQARIYRIKPSRTEYVHDLHEREREPPRDAHICSMATAAASVRVTSGERVLADEGRPMETPPDTGASQHNKRLDLHGTGCHSSSSSGCTPGHCCCCCCCCGCGGGGGGGCSCWAVLSILCSSSM